MEGTAQDREAFTRIALDELRLMWGDEYQVGHDGGKWTARRISGGGKELTDCGPFGLHVQIRADWAREGTL